MRHNPIIREHSYENDLANISKDVSIIHELDNAIDWGLARDAYIGTPISDGFYLWVTIPMVNLGQYRILYKIIDNNNIHLYNINKV